MRPGTIAMLTTLLICIIMSALFFHHQHSEHLMSLSQGAMSKETKDTFLAKGVDCLEVYEVQGYEGPESVFRMFQLSQHEFSQLNPGKGIFYNQGDILCVKGIYGVSNATAFAWFWPLVAVACGATGFCASVFINKLKLAAEEKKAAAAKKPASGGTVDKAVVVMESGGMKEDTSAVGGSEIIRL